MAQIRNAWATDYLSECMQKTEDNTKMDLKNYGADNIHLVKDR
jgi:hypothetical protein